MRRTVPALDMATIVEASLAIADADGLDGLTMRRLASELDVTPMAIYHHVANKEQLIDLMADESLKALPPINPRARWPRELQRFFTSLHELYLAHPALAQAMTQRPLQGPVAIVIGEQVVALLTDSGLDDNQATSALITLTSYTIGASLYRLSRRRDQATAERQRLGELTAHTAPIAHRLVPKIAAAADSNKQFADGLARLIETYHAEVGGR